MDESSRALACTLLIEGSESQVEELVSSIRHEGLEVAIRAAPGSKGLLDALAAGVAVELVVTGSRYVLTRAVTAFRERTPTAVVEVLENGGDETCAGAAIGAGEEADGEPNPDGITDDSDSDAPPGS